MLLLTDRLNEGLRLKDALGLMHCTVMSLHQALSDSVVQPIVICDAALDNAMSFELLQAALARRRAISNVPVLCLTRDPSQLTLSQAKAIGATAILPYQTPPAKLMSTIRDILGSDLEVAGESRGTIHASIQETAKVFSHLMVSARRRQRISSASLEYGGNIVVAAIQKAYISAWLDIVWTYDDVTYQHSLLVAGLTAAFSVKLGLSLSSQRLLSQAALVHDIGKARISHDILNKPGPLTAAEMAIMRTHATIGYRLLIQQGGFDQRLLEMVGLHHELLDGSGYPDGLCGPQVPQFVRLLTICDIYAALIERRSYKAPIPPQKALSILADMGSKLDGDLLSTFQDVVSNG